MVFDSLFFPYYSNVMRNEYETLKRILSEDPVLWAVIRGASSVGAIVMATLYGPKEVTRQLLLLEEEGWVERNEFGAWIPCEEYEELKPVAKAIWKKGKGMAGENTIPTERQLSIWEAIRRAHGEEPFTTKEAAQANGYSKAGFMGTVLRALVKKGMLLELGGRPQRWKVVERNNPAD